MKLSRDTMKSLISGAVRFSENENGIMPIRFTGEQSEWYRKNPHFADKVFASAGMKMDFTTDAREMTVRYVSCSGSSRKFCFFDVYQDGVLIQHCGTENREEHPEGVLFLKMDGKIHRITVYFPNLSGVTIQEMELLDHTILTPEKRAEKLLVFGDSITQGYDAVYPSFSYINRVADHFNMELVNKAVGGDTFTQEMGLFKEDFVPTRIFIAYGTNDWSGKKRDAFEHDTEGFFRNLRNRFPSVPMHVLLPIWREDHLRITFAGTFQDMYDFIRSVCGKYRGIQTIDGMSLFPHLPFFFSDHYLHPNDTGFLLMADGVIRELEKEIR